MSGGANLLPKSMPISFFRRVSFLRCFRTPSAPLRRILVHTGMLPCLSLHGLKLCKFVSRSDVILISDRALDFYPILFYRRASRCAAFQTKVVHLCFALVRIKMPLLMYFQPSFDLFTPTPETYYFDLFNQMFSGFRLSGADATPSFLSRSYTPVAALSTISRVSQGCRSYTPPKGPVAPHPGPPCRVSQVVWTSETPSRSRGCSCYPCGCRATL